MAFRTPFRGPTLVAPGRDRRSTPGVRDRLTNRPCQAVADTFPLECDENTMLGYQVQVVLDVFVRHDQGVSFASLAPGERSMRQGRSDFALIRKLEAYYGGDIPSSGELWGCPIFDEALNRRGLLFPQEAHD